MLRVASHVGCQPALVSLWIVTVLFSLSLVSDPAIVNGVYWSESLNKVFVDNFDRDPSLIWQYFGSAKGFFRQYPGECPAWRAVIRMDDPGCLSSGFRSWCFFSLPLGDNERV